MAAADERRRSWSHEAAAWRRRAVEWEVLVGLYWDWPLPAAESSK